MGDFRPVLDLDYVKQIKAKYPETATLTNVAAIRWALDRLLGSEEIVNEMG
jgi:hypothetical protein